MPPAVQFPPADTHPEPLGVYLGRLACSPPPIWKPSFSLSTLTMYPDDVSIPSCRQDTGTTGNWNSFLFPYRIFLNKRLTMCKKMLGHYWKIELPPPSFLPPSPTEKGFFFRFLPPFFSLVAIFLDRQAASHGGRSLNILWPMPLFWFIFASYKGVGTSA